MFIVPAPPPPSYKESVKDYRKRLAHWKQLRDEIREMNGYQETKRHRAPDPTVDESYDSYKTKVLNFLTQHPKGFWDERL